MPFDLTHTSSSFQCFINDVLREDLDEFYIAYLDKMLIYANTIEEHYIYARQILEKVANTGSTSSRRNANSTYRKLCSQAA